MTDKKITVSPETEKQILYKSAVDPAFRTRARKKLSDYKFSDKMLVWFWRIILSSPRTESVPSDAFQSRAKIEFHKNPDKLDLFSSFVSSVFSVNGESASISLDTLEDANLFNHAQFSIVSAAKSLEVGDVSKAIGIMSKVKKKTSDSGNMIDYIGSWVDRQIDNIQNRDIAKICVPTGLPLLDKIIDGLKFSELGLISGTTGRGKSIFTVNVALASAIAGFTTVLFSTEMKISQVASRLDSRVFGINYKRFKYADFNDNELKDLMTKFERRKPQLQNRLFLFDTPIRQCSLSFVEEKILELNELGYNVDCAIIDSPEHFDSSRQYDQKRHEHADVFWSLKGLARGEGAIDREMAVWATVQGKQEDERKVAGIRTVSESHDKARIADVLLTLNQSTSQEKNSEILLNLAKYRDGESKRLILLKAELEYMRYTELGYYEDVRPDLVQDLTQG